MKENYDVSITACKNYEREEVLSALKEVLEPIGGLEWVKPGMKIVLKANLVSAKKQDTAATTHPAVLSALTTLLTERGASVVIGDSPGGLFTASYVNHIYSVTGMKDTISYGAVLNQNFGQSQGYYEEAVVAKNFEYTAYLDEADAIIDVCKLKTHGMMALSAAAKNMFGTIPGTRKPEYHFRFPNATDFARMIVDLDEYFKPRLSIVDAVYGMEGNGPTQGTPRFIGALAASASPHALDLLCARVIGLTAKDVPTLQAAQERKLIPDTAEELKVWGDAKSFYLSDYQNSGAHTDLTFHKEGKGLWSRFYAFAAKKALDSRPAVAAAECVGCGECSRICPAKAICMKNSLPEIDRSVCIRCFCCQEFCPKGAMKVHRTFIARILNRD